MTYSPKRCGSAQPKNSRCWEGISAALHMSSADPNPQRATVAIVGGGLAGLSAGSALADAGYRVELFERRPYLGGRASSYELPGTGEVVDNCQHVLLGCCTNLIEFYRRLGVEQQIRWYDEITFILPGGRSSTLKPGALPRADACCAGVPGVDQYSTWRTSWQSRAPCWQWRRRLPKDNGENFLSWLLRHGQTQQAIDRFWAPVLVSALNEELDRVSVRYAALVFRDSFLKSAEAGRMGVPAVPLSQLYGTAAHYIEARGGQVHLRAAVDSVRCDADGVRLCVGGEERARGLCDPRDALQRRGEAVARCARTGALAPCSCATSKLLPSPAFIYGLTARSRRWSMRCCWSGPSSGCSTNRRYFRRAGNRRRTAATLSWWSARRKRWSRSRAEEIIELAVQGAWGILSGGARSQADEVHCGEGSARDVLAGAGRRCLSSVAQQPLAASLLRGRLDGHRMALHHGRRGAQRLWRCGGAERTQVPGARPSGEGIDAVVQVNEISRQL